MAEALATAVISKLASLVVDLPTDYIVEEIKALKSAKKDLKQMHDTIEAICAVLEDAEDKGYSNNTIKIWLRDLKSVFYDIDDLLDEVAYDAKLRKANEGHFIRQLRYYASSSNPIISRFHWSHKIRSLREKLDGIVAKRDMFGLSERPVDHSSRDEVRDPLDGCAFVRESSIIGREKAKQDILDKLLAVGNANELSVLPIVGMGGIGKTALAKLVYADVQHFDLKLWACVSDTFQVRQIIENILKDGSGDVTPDQDLNTLVKNLHALLQDKKYFIVLDDVWVEDVAMWKKLKDLLAISKAGSVALITTRNKTVASITHANIEPYDLERLPEDVCWSIFKGLAFSQGEETRYPCLCEIGKSIIKKCCGIPLVVIALGSFLRYERKNKEWQKINEMDSFVELNQQYGKVIQLLKLSYDKLPSHLKPCFANLSIFPKDTYLCTIVATNIWSALGLIQVKNENKIIEEVGYSYFMELVTRSLLQDSNMILDNLLCASKIHDLLHDLAMDILGEELSVTTLDKMNVSKFTRHVVWGYEGGNSLKDKEFPKELLKARNARTFQFTYKIQHISRPFLEGIISHCSCLRILGLDYGWFEELPASIENLIHLRYLNLSCNPILKTLPGTICKLLNLETLLVRQCEALKEMPKNVFQLQSLRSFAVTTFQISLVDNKLNKLSCLHTLRVDSCQRLESLWDSGNVGGLTSLQFIVINNCPKLRYLPTSMKFLNSLKILHIGDCEELDMGKGEWLQGLQSLQMLTIQGLPKLNNFPDGIQSAASSLMQLILQNCGALVELPGWLQQFASLRQILIDGCPNLLGLPLGFCHLKSLQKLVIRGCPHLTKRCAEFTGEDYPLIQHITNVELDGVLFTSNPNPSQ